MPTFSFMTKYYNNDVMSYICTLPKIKQIKTIYALPSSTPSPPLQLWSIKLKVNFHTFTGNYISFLFLLKYQSNIE